MFVACLLHTLRHACGFFDLLLLHGTLLACMLAACMQALLLHFLLYPHGDVVAAICCAFLRYTCLDILAEVPQLCFLWVRSAGSHRVQGSAAVQLHRP